MNGRKAIIPGEKRTISFPRDIDSEFLNYLNGQINFSGTLLTLAFEGFKSRQIQNLESRIEKLESMLTSNNENVISIKNSRGTPHQYNFEATDNILPDEEDDVI